MDSQIVSRMTVPPKQRFSNQQNLERGNGMKTEAKQIISPRILSLTKIAISKRKPVQKARKRSLPFDVSSGWSYANHVPILTKDRREPQIIRTVIIEIKV
mgnify:CR=1 FL=1